MDLACRSVGGNFSFEDLSHEIQKPIFAILAILPIARMVLKLM